jgi:hypothetical protein
MPAYTETTPAPDGWRWASRPVRDRYNEWQPGRLTFAAADTMRLTQIETLFTALDVWSTEYECLIQEYGEPETVGGDIRTHRVFYAYPGQNTEAHRQRYWPDQWCRHGHNHGPVRTSIICRHGDGGAEHLVDRSVNGRTQVGFVLWTPEEQKYRLANSVGVCSHPLPPSEVQRRRALPENAAYNYDPHVDRRTRRCGKGVLPQFQACTDCVPRVECVRCHGQFPDNFTVVDVADNQVRCNDYWNGYHCDSCGEWSDNGCLTVEGHEGSHCHPCRVTINADRYEEWDETQDTVPAAVLALANDKHRPVRTCSIELEAVEGGSGLARVLAGAGLTASPDVLGYHSSNNSLAQSGFCHVERDSSLGHNGGELIFDRIRLDVQEDVNKLHQAVGLVRQQIKAGLLQVSLACGLHVHVDAHQFGIGDVRNLVLVTNYLEDLLYRLSAAKYKKHRGTGHAIPLPKGPYETKRDFGLHFFANNEHHSALNVTPYWEAVRNRCVCGATNIGEHDTCTCNLGKCTFEFRHFNGTANFRKIHAYAALSQSLVAFAKIAGELRAEDFPPQEYDGRHSGAGQVKKDKWDERLRWVLANLYFAPNERESFRYCVDHSILNELGVERIEDIFATPYVEPSAPEQVIEHRNARGSVLSDGTFRGRSRRGY